MHMPPQPSNNTSSNSAHDSASGAGGAFNLANMIRSGALDFGDDNLDPDMQSSGRSQGHSQGQRFGRPAMNPMVGGPAPKHRSTHSMSHSHLQPANPVNSMASTLPTRETRESNTKGNAAAYLAVETAPPPDWFGGLSMGYKPTSEMIFQVLPAIEPCRSAAATTAGVIRVNNIPYNTPRSEITAFVGRNAQIVAQPAGSPYHAVHIIMERHTGKTMDAFVEFSRGSEASWVVNQFQKRMVQGRHPRVGDRQVEVVLSSQKELMSELFPRAKNVRWEGATPVVSPNTEMYYSGVESAGFTGFMQTEEVVMVTKHAETPHRVSQTLNNLIVPQLT